MTIDDVDSKEVLNNGSDIEKKLTIEELKIKYADILNNPALQAICSWRDPFDECSDKYPCPTDEEYAARAVANLPKMMELYKKSSEYKGDSI